MRDWITSIFVASMGLMFLLLAPILLAILMGAVIFGAAVIVIWFVLKVLKEEPAEPTDDEKRI